MCLQAGFAAEGAESGTPFNDINLLEKVSCVSSVNLITWLSDLKSQGQNTHTAHARDCFCSFKQVVSGERD